MTTSGLQPAAAPGSPPSRHRTAAKLFFLAGLLALGGLATLGLPGALWLAMSGPLARGMMAHRATADTMWTMALLHTMIWPFFLPVSYAVAAICRPPGRPRTLATLVGTAVAAVLAALILQAVHGRV